MSRVLRTPKWWALNWRDTLFADAAASAAQSARPGCYARTPEVRAKIAAKLRKEWWTAEVEAQVRALLAERMPHHRIATQIGVGLSTLERRLVEMRARDARPADAPAPEPDPELPQRINAAAFERAFVPPAPRPVAPPAAPAPARPRPHKHYTWLDYVPDPAFSSPGRRAGCAPVPL